MSFGLGRPTASTKPEESYWQIIERTLLGCHELKNKNLTLAEARAKSWELWKSAPRAKYLAVSCDNPRCINPNHLETASRLCRRSLHPMTDSNRVQHDGKSKCRQCFLSRKCKRCQRTVDEDNTYYRGDVPMGCLWCRNASCAAKAHIRRLVGGKPVLVRCDHRLLRSTTMILTWKGHRCALCWSRRVCRAGHALEGNSVLHDMVRDGKMFTVERCLTCHTNRYATCKRGHDLSIEANVYVRPDGKVRCCRICRDMVNKENRHKFPRRQLTREEVRIKVAMKKRADARKLREDPVGRQAYLDRIKDKERLLWRLEKFFVTGDPERVFGPQRENPSHCQEQLQGWILEYGDLLTSLDTSVPVT